MDEVHLHSLLIRYHPTSANSIFIAKLYANLCSKVYFDDSNSDHLNILCILDPWNYLALLDIMNLFIWRDHLGLLSIFLLFDIMMILS
jgi:hypothetical protein